MQSMWPQATVSNPLIDSIICPSVLPSVRRVVCGPFDVFVFVFNIFDTRDDYYDYYYYQRGGSSVVMHLSSHWSPVEIMFLSV